MTFNVGSISGGTRAGWRRVKQTATEWVCSKCGRNNARYFTRCPDCTKWRPE